ncbi:telomere-protecting terminal protein Tpg [Streptomyces sioyaensis]|uniref:telomere-protecting terminal protein Tpg n=1 Tax=Streptomyces sioyaensis TaxID=67364 RepID=UPI0036ECD6FD
MGIIGDALSQAARAAWTRPLPKSAGARLRFLLKREKGSTRSVAQRLGVSQRTVQRWVKGEQRPTGARAAALEREAARDWQPHVTAQAQQRSARTGIVVETRARFGFTAAPGTTDDGRIRRITETLRRPGAPAMRTSSKSWSGRGLGTRTSRTGAAVPRAWT